MFTLSWQPPYDWPWMLGFLAARAVEGVETVEELSYVRSLSVGEHRGLVSVVPDLHAIYKFMPEFRGNEHTPLITFQSLPH